MIIKLPDIKKIIPQILEVESCFNNEKQKIKKWVEANRTGVSQKQCKWEMSAQGMLYNLDFSRNGL